MLRFHIQARTHARAGEGGVRWALVHMYVCGGWGGGQACERALVLHPRAPLGRAAP